MAETPVVLVTSHLLKATDVSIVYGLDNLRTVLKFYKTLVFKWNTSVSTKD